MFYIQGPNSDVFYTITSVEPISGDTLFDIDSDTGDITVAHLLSTDPETSRYTVSTAEIFVFIFVHSMIATMFHPVLHNNCIYLKSNFQKSLIDFK